MGGTYADKSIERCIENPRGRLSSGARVHAQTEEIVEGEVVSLTREPSLPGEEAEAETLSPSMKILGVATRSTASAAPSRPERCSSRHRIRPFVDGAVYKIQT